MGFFDSLSNGIKNHFDKNNQYREAMEELQRQADAEKLMAFKEAFASNAKEVAIAQAKKDAAELSGLGQLRAINRSRNLQDQPPVPGTFYEKLSDFTKKNKLRMQQNMEKTNEKRQVAGFQKEQRQQNNVKQREERLQNSSGLRGKSTWRM